MLREPFMRVRFADGFRIFRRKIAPPLAEGGAIFLFCRGKRAMGSEEVEEIGFERVEAIKAWKRAFFKTFF